MLVESIQPEQPLYDRYKRMKVKLFGNQKIPLSLQTDIMMAQAQGEIERKSKTQESTKQADEKKS